MLNIIGIGLRGTGSLTLDEFDALRTSDIVYLDIYTSIGPKDILEKLRNIADREIIPADRNMIESESILKDAEKLNVSLLVIGDGLTATTHNQLRYSAMEKGIKVKIFENASAVNTAAGKIGLLHYKVGPPVSLPFVSSNFFPLSVIDKVKRNYDSGLHTPILIDLKDGQNMPFASAWNIIMEMQKRRGYAIIDENVCVVSRLSFPDEYIVYGRLSYVDPEKILSPYLIFITSNLDPNEERFIKKFAIHV